MRTPFRLACFVACALTFCIPQTAAACSIPPPPPPPPRTSTETEAQFAARSKKWYGDLAERERMEALPAMAAHENGLWAKAKRVVLARVKKVRSIRLRGSEGQWFDSPLVALRPIEWLKGRGSAKGLSVHFLSDDSCDEGGGDAPHGGVGELFLLFYKPGRFDPRDLLGSIREDRVVTMRSQEAIARFRRETSSGPPRGP